MPDANSPIRTWSVSKHETIPQAEFGLNPLEGHVYLHAYLAAEGEEYAPPYNAVRTRITEILEELRARKRPGQAPSDDVSDQRLRTWKADFESFGFLRVASVDNRIHLTPLGRAVRSLFGSLDEKVEGANDQLAKIAVGVLSRHRLRNPLNGTEYPEDSDLRHYRAIWRAMRELDGRLHWQELNRVLMHVLYEKDVPDAIATIRSARKATGGNYSAAGAPNKLGAPAVPEGAQTKRRITPWLSQAGFGGLLISGTDDEEGYRSLAQKYIPLIDEALQDTTPLPANARVSPEAYIAFVSDLPAITSTPPSAHDQVHIDTVIKAIQRHGQSKIICLSGLPGTGKTHLAKLAAMQLVAGDSYRFEEIQFHPSTSYEDFIEGFMPKPSGEGYELVPKVFRIMNRRARLDPNQATYVLLIEELTRTDVHAVLGELMTYVEHRDRPFQLAISGKEERVAPNLVLLATMNPRDKAALALDHAILRRIHRIELKPSADRLKELLAGTLDDVHLAKLVEWFRKHETVLPFGHAEFARATSELDLREVWTGTLRPFLTNVSGEVREQYRTLAEEYPWQ